MAVDALLKQPSPTVLWTRGTCNCCTDSVRYGTYVEGER